MFEKKLIGWVGSGPSDPCLTNATIGHAGTRRLVKFVKLEKEDIPCSNPRVPTFNDPRLTLTINRERACTDE